MQEAGAVAARHAWRLTLPCASPLIVLLRRVEEVAQARPQSLQKGSAQQFPHDLAPLVLLDALVATAAATTHTLAGFDNGHGAHAAEHV